MDAPAKGGGRVRANAPGGGAAAGISYLRARTVRRSLRAYADWVGRAVGWWTLVYLLAWLVVFVIAGLETLTPLEQPSGVPHWVLMVTGAAPFATLALAGRVPPVILDRRDLYRLGLAPVRPWLALRWRFSFRAWLAAGLGAFIGGVWSVLAPALFGIHAPWAAPVLAAVAVARFSGAWLRYARNVPGAGASGWIVIGAGLLVAVVPYGLADALSSSSPLVLVMPLLLAALSVALVRRSLGEEWPPRFAPQSLVLTQLQAMRTLQLMAGLAGFVKQAAAEGGERRRLLAALHDTPGATRPNRSLPLPAANVPAWRGVAWRTASELWRRPVWRLGWLLLRVAAAAAAVIVVYQGSASAASGLGAGGTAAGVLGGAIGVLLAAFLVANAGSTLLGPELNVGTLPLEPGDRSLGRVAPGAIVILTLALAFPLYSAPALGGLIGAASLVLLVLFVLEKYGSWSGSGSGRWEAQLIAAVFAALPSLVLAAFGVPGWTVGVQVALLFIVLLITV